MNRVELLEHALDLAKQLGYTVRHECLGGRGGGCELKGQKLLFLDLDLGPNEQLEQVADALAREPDIASLTMPTELREMLASP